MPPKDCRTRSVSRKELRLPLRFRQVGDEGAKAVEAIDGGKDIEHTTGADEDMSVIEAGRSGGRGIPAKG